MSGLQEIGLILKSTVALIFQYLKCLHLMHSEVACNHFHNILSLLDVLPNFLFTTSEAMGDYYL